MDILKVNPYETPPSYEKLMGNLSGFYSRRINMQHRLVYQVLPNCDGFCDETGEEYDGVVKIIRMWTHMKMSDDILDIKAMIGGSVPFSSIYT